MRASLVAVLALVSLAACAKPAANGAASANGQPSAQASSAPSGNACDRHLISQADVQPLLTEPVASMKALEGDPQSCVFTTSGFSSITVMLRPGAGPATLDAWKKGQMNLTATPLPGVGDDALWQSELKEVIATKNGVLCDIVAGSGPATSKATQQNVGALCNKIFAAM